MCHHPDQFCDHKDCDNGNMFLICHDTSYDHMYGGHWSNAGGDTKYLICHVTSQNHMIEGSSNFLSRFSLWCVTTLPSVRWP